MKVGDLVRFKNQRQTCGKVFLIMRIEMDGFRQKVWIYPDPEADEVYDHTDDDNYYYNHFFEVISESR
jgi:hypothetical protein